MSYAEFLAAKAQISDCHGFDAGSLPDYLFGFQEHLTRWAIRQGRAAIFADCGLGKTPMQLTWAQSMQAATGLPVLIVTPLAVTFQTAAEAAKFGIDAAISRDGAVPAAAGLASADYLLIFRKRGANPIPVTHERGFTTYHGAASPSADVLRYKNHEGNQIENRYSQWVWRQYASSVWDDVRGNLGQFDSRDHMAVLPYREARDDEDEKHVHPLQLDVIRRSVDLRSNPGETVLTPFMGVGSEVYAAVELGRRGIGIELKPSYYRQAVKNLHEVSDTGSGDIALW